MALFFMLLAVSPTTLGDLLVWGHLPRDFWNPERLARARYVGFGFSALWLLYTATFLWSLTRDDRAEGGVNKRDEGFVGTGATRGAALVVLLAASLAVRIRFLPVPLDYDEAYTFWNYARHGPIEALARFDSTNNHPLNSLLMAMCYRFGGAEEWVIRLPVFLAGVLVPVLVFLACAAFGEVVAGFCAGAAAVVSIPLVEYSANARGYMLLACANLLATLGAASMVRGRRGSALLVGGMVLGIWSLPSAVLALPGMLVWVWRRTRSWVEVLRVGLGVAAVGGLVYVPGYIAMGTRALENPFVLPLELSLWLIRYPLALIEALGAVAVPVPYDGIAARMHGRAVDLFIRWLVHPEALGCLVVSVFFVGISVWARGAVASWATAVLASVAVACMALRLAPPPRVFAPYIPLAIVLFAVGLIRAGGKVQEARARQGRFFERTLATAAVLLIGVGLAFYWRRPLASRFDRYGWRLYVPAVAERVAERSGGRKCCIVASLPTDLPLRVYLWREGVLYEWGLDGGCAGGRYLAWLGPDPPVAAALRADPVLKPFASALQLGPLRPVGYFGPLVLYELGAPAEPPEGRSG